VIVEDDEVPVMEVVVVVVISLHPHHPGVWHVVVVVAEEVVVGTVVVLVVVVIVSFPLTNFQLKQSTHPGSNVHFGTSSYTWMTSLITPCIRWYPNPIRHPLSLTTS
jgi:hypothetical protein